MSATRPLAIFCGTFDGNSTAKISARLANAFVARGVPTDLLVTASRAPVPEPTDPRVRIVRMGAMGSLERVPRMALYLLARRPSSLLAHRIRENRCALAAARLARTGTPVFVTVHGPMTVKLANLRPDKRLRRSREVLRWYPKNRGIVAISEETAADLRGLLGPAAPLAVIPNPIVTLDLAERARAPIEHPWLARPDGVPVLVFAGRLEREKDLPTLLHAFARLCEGRAARLILLGEGSLRPHIEGLRAELGLLDRVDMPGWAANPYPYLKAAQLTVLSSTWDALPTVLIESLALGTPAVATACGAGPREILDGGRLGPLVPPGDPSALARAMAETLDRPPPPETLMAGVARYGAERNAALYLELMLGDRMPGRAPGQAGR